nr:MAG TPA: hypothetical protein [Caudoviricetes sp.]
MKFRSFSFKYTATRVTSYFIYFLRIFCLTRSVFYNIHIFIPPTHHYDYVSDTKLGVYLFQIVCRLGICVACGMIIGHLSSQNSLCFLFGSISICELLIQLKTCRLDATGKTLQITGCNLFLSDISTPLTVDNRVGVEHLYDTISGAIINVINIKILSHNLVLLNFFKRINRMCCFNFDNFFIFCNRDRSNGRCMHPTWIRITLIVFYISELSNPADRNWTELHCHTDPFRIPSVSTSFASINTNCVLHNVIAFRHLNQIVH